MTPAAARTAIQAQVDAYYANEDSDGLFSIETDRHAALLLGAGTDLPLLADLMWCRFFASDDPQHLATAIDLADQVAAIDPRQRPEVLGMAIDALDDPRTLADVDDGQRESWAGLFFSMTVALSADASDDLARLNRIINGLTLSMDLTPAGHPVRSRAAVLQAHYRSLQARLTGRVGEAEAAATTIRALLAEVPDDDPDLPHLRQLLGDTLLTVYELAGTIESRVALAEALLESVDDEMSAELGAEIAELPPGHGPITTEQALALGRLRLAVHPVGDPARPAALFSWAAALSQRAGDRQSVADNTAAVAAIREMLDLLRLSDDDSTDSKIRRAGALTFLGRFLGQRNELTGDTAALLEAIDVTRLARDLIPPGHPIQAMNLANLGSLLIVLHERDSDPGVLDESIQVLRTAVDIGGPDAPHAMSMLSAAYLSRFLLNGHLEDIDESVALGRRAVADGAGHPALPDWLGNLGNAFRLRFNRLGRLADADAAVEMSRHALDITPIGHADRARASHNFGSALLDRYRRTSDANDLDGGVTAMREAVTLAAPGTFGAELTRSALGRALTDRYERYGVAANLDEAIVEIRKALNALGATALARPGTLNNLAAALHFRSHLTGSSTDLDDAIGACREALRLSEPGSDDATNARLNLGYLLTSRYLIATRRADLDEAIAVLRTAATWVAAARRPSVQLNLANALGFRYRHSRDTADLDESIAVVRAAGDDPEVGPLRRLRYHAALGSALSTRFSHTGAREDIEDAIALLRNVVQNTASDEPEQAMRLHFLGTALLYRGDPQDRAEALQTARRTAATQAAPSSLRLDAALRWAGMAVEDGDPHTALEGYERALPLLPLLAWRALSRADQERQLTEATGVSSDASAVAIIVGDPQRAAELLEAGRAVLWSQVLDTRSDLAALRQVRPELANRVEEVRTLLDRSSDLPSLNSGPALPRDSTPVV